MKNLQLLFGILISGCPIVQEDQEEVKLWTINPSYVITHNDDTIHGYIKLNNYVDNQRKALFSQNPNDKKETEKY